MILPLVSVRGFVRAKVTPFVSKLFFHKKYSDIKNPERLPKRVYIFWNSGFENAPKIVRTCVESWKDMNPTWQVIKLDQNAANEFLDLRNLSDNISVVHYADVLRTKILAEHGGVWTDPTVLCTRSLDDWLLPLMLQTDIFMFSVPGKDRLICSWFIASTSHNPIIEMWFKFLYAFHKSQNFKKPYFSSHYVFEFLVRKNSEIASLFRSMPKLNADAPHLLQGMLRMSFPIGQKEISMLFEIPLHKLSHKFNIDGAQLNNFLNLWRKKRKQRGDLRLTFEQFLNLASQIKKQRPELAEELRRILK